MEESKQTIAEAFSLGKFEKTYPALSDDIVWNIIGEKVIEGKKAVIENCNETSAYFKTVETEFIILDTIVSDSKIVVLGTAKFIQNGKIIQSISASDVYSFNKETKIVKIASYCIAT